MGQKCNKPRSCGTFATMELPSKLVEAAVDQIASLPGIGRRTALRLALHLLRRDAERVEAFARSLTAMREGVRGCSRCHNLCEGGLCAVCEDPARDAHQVCVVEDVRDLLAIESLRTYRGTYHVLGGVISPMDGVGPSDLFIADLVDRMRSAPTEAEVIFALPTTMEGETTAFYLYRKLGDLPLRITAISRGVAVGDDLQHADEATLAQSLKTRMPYHG
jgi:recombination protein RecR